MESLSDPAQQRYLSAASAWEIAIKYAVGKLSLPEPPAVYVPERMRSSRVHGLAVTPAHALGGAALPPYHRDPFDRLLVVQAQMEGMTLITADATLARYDVRMTLVPRHPAR